MPFSPSKSPLRKATPETAGKSAARAQAFPLATMESASCPCGGGCPRCDPSSSVTSALQLPSEPLDAATRTYMEPRLGRSLEAVRIHRDATAADSAQAQGARAYAVGRDLVFGEGQYAPHTSIGRKLLAHELTHAVQQNFSPNRTRAEPPANTDSSLEAEAGRAADSLAAGGSFRPALRAAPSVACDKPPGAPARGKTLSFAEREENQYSAVNYKSENKHVLGSFGGTENYKLYRTTTQIEVEVRIHLVRADDPSKTYDAADSVTTGWLWAIDSVWNNRFRFTNGKTSLPLVFEPKFVKSNAHFNVVVHPGSGQGEVTNEDNWHESEEPLPGISHEFGHMLGNPNEYNIPGSINEISRKSGLTEAEKKRSSYEGITGEKRPRRPGGHTMRKSVMGTGKTAFRRHVSKILTFFNDQLRSGEGRRHEPRFHTEYIR